MLVITGIAAVVIILATALALIFKPESNGVKKVIFGLIVVSAVTATFYMAGATVYKNVTSVTGGPVHWHADFLIYKCGEPVDLEEPTGLSNRIGSSVFHEHGDNRVHVEGTVKDYSDVSWKSFIEVVGGEWNENEVIMPITGGDEVIMEEGGNCPELEGEAHLQTFVYQTDPDKGTVVMKKLTRNGARDYIPSPHSTVPPGDCIVMEYSIDDLEEPKDICPLLKVELEQGNLELVK